MVSVPLVIEYQQIMILKITVHLFEAVADCRFPLLLE